MYVHHLHPSPLTEQRHHHSTHNQSCCQGEERCWHRVEHSWWECCDHLGQGGYKHCWYLIWHDKNIKVMGYCWPYTLSAYNKIHFTLPWNLIMVSTCKQTCMFVVTHNKFIPEHYIPNYIPVVLLSSSWFFFSTLLVRQIQDLVFNYYAWPYIAIKMDAKTGSIVWGMLCQQNFVLAKLCGLESRKR